LRHQLQQFLPNLEELYALGQHHVPLHGQLYSVELDFEQFFLASGAVLLLIGIGIIFLALGVAYLVMAYGLWNGKRWAWTITLILSGIGIILGVISIAAGNIGSIVSIIIQAVVIYYLYRPSVKVYFGK
jgi:uncharacterized membrane protein (DUF2068 family)